MNELYHFGVKGMRWGVRRQVHEESSAGWDRRKKATDLSTADLDKRLNRLRKEAEYKKLTESSGSKFVKKLLAVAVVAPLVALTAKAGQEAIGKGVEALKPILKNVGEASYYSMLNTIDSMK